MNTAEVHLALAGAGSSGLDHLQAAQKLPVVRFVAVADPDVALAEAAASRFHIERVGSDITQVLDSDVDGVVVTTPTDVHEAVAVPLLERGLPVLLEKPLARELGAASRIVAAAERAHAILHTGFVRRFDDLWAAAVEEIRASRIGRPVTWRHSQIKAGPIDKPWYNALERGGGPFLDECIHTIDIALDLFGSAEWVFAHLRTLRKGNTASDSGTATLRFSAGDELMLSWSWGLPRHCRAQDLFDFHGPEGVMIVAERNGGARLEIATTSGRTSRLFLEKALPTAFANQLSEFVRAIKAGDGYTPDIRALEALRVSLALLHSGACQSRVDLDGAPAVGSP